MKRIYYNGVEESFFSLVGEGLLWGGSGQRVYYLRAWHSCKVFAVPDYIFDLDFFRMDNRKIDRQLFEMGWSEFAVKKFMKDYENDLKDDSGRTGY